MTRFARAKGSKASNEKKPEEGTSWTEIKANIVSKSEVRSEVEEDSEENVPSTEEIRSFWAVITSEYEDNKRDKKRKKTSDKKASVPNDVKKDVKKKKKTLIEETGEVGEKQKRGKKIKNQVEEQKKRSVKLEEEEIKKKKQKKEKNQNELTGNKNNEKEKNQNEVTVNKNNEEKNTNIATNKREKKRKKTALESTTMRINGEEVKVVPFDGFLIREEDAIRLTELRKSMRQLPAVEREKAIKLERRRAEKALARLRKRVCFHCRGTGHNLSECPDLEDKQTSGTGICYKCGSTEHTHFQCKVSKGQEYRFAECFICKEQGHISRQCPDNPRGLYPKGGACNVCGDVTHLKKDCPEFAAEKEEHVLTVNKRTDRIGIEELDFHEPERKPKKQKLNKYIKF